MSTSYTDRFTATQIQTWQANYEPLPLTQNLTLYWPSQFTTQSLPSSAIIYRIMNVTPSAAGWDIFLPPAAVQNIVAGPINPIVSVGQEAVFNNIGAYSFDLCYQDGTSLVTIDPGEAYYIYLTNNTTLNGTYSVAPFLAGGSTVTSVALDINNTDPSYLNLTVTGSPITSAGTFTLDFPSTGDLGSIIRLGTNYGFVTRAAGPTWATANIVGTAGQTTFSYSAPNWIVGLNPSVTISSFLTAANITVGAGAGNFISSSSALNQIGIANPNNLSFYNTAASQYVSFVAASALAQSTAFTWPTTNPSLSQILAVTAVTAGTPTLVQLGWSNAPSFPGVSTTNTLPYYTNTAGSLGDTDLGTMGGANSYLSINNSTLRFINASGTFYTAVTGGAVGSNITFTLPVSVGTAGQLIQTDGSGTLSFSTLLGIPALQTTQQTGSSTVNAVTPGTQQFHASADKAWAMFVGNPVSTTISYNIASITRTGAGVYSVTLTNAMSATTFFVGVTIAGSGYYTITTNTGSNFTINTFNPSAVATDFSQISFVVKGQLA